MNIARRKRLAEALTLLESAKDVIEEVMEEEQEAFDNLPESLQGADRGVEMEEYIGDLENAVDSLDDLLDVIGEIAATGK